MSLKKRLIFVCIAALSLVSGSRPSNAQAIGNIPTSTTLQILNPLPLVNTEEVRFLVTVTAFGHPVISGKVFLFVPPRLRMRPQPAFTLTASG